MNKLLNEFYKLFYKLTHNNRYKHNRKRWPHVKITRGKSGDIVGFSYKKQTHQITPVSSLKNIFSGSILLVASGPSIRSIDFSTKPDIPFVGVNGAYSLNNLINFNLYVITDIHFFSQRTDIVKNVILNEKIILFVQVDGLVKLIELFGSQNILCKISLIEDAFKLTYEPIMTLAEIENSTERNHSIYFFKDSKIEHEPIAFETNIAHGVFPAKTVVYWTLQIIMYLGFKKIYLAGVDMNNFNKPRFYETADNMTYSQLELDFEKNILPAFRHASYVSKELGVEIINLSVNSALDENIFKKQSYENCIKYFLND